jgi:hypothetical protein
MYYWLDVADEKIISGVCGERYRRCFSFVGFAHNLLHALREINVLTKMLEHRCTNEPWCQMKKASQQYIVLLPKKHHQGVFIFLVFK